MSKFISIGIAGHVDHGKTSLVQCLTGIDTDRLKEEKRRGLSIEPGVAPLKLPSGRHVALIDVPGHSDFVKNAIRGLIAVDMAILVVAADDGIMPQTRDHLAILNFLGIKSGFVVLSKADLVDSETLELATMDIQETLNGSFLERKPIIPFSAIDRQGLPQIFSTIEREIDCVQVKSTNAAFRLWIDQARSLPGFGTIVSGTVLSGSVKPDDTVELLPAGKQIKVRFIEVHHCRVDKALAGQRAGLNLPGVSLQEVDHGMSLAAPGVIRPARFLNCQLSLIRAANRPLLNHQRIRLFVGTGSTTALLVIMQKDQINPGETALVQLRAFQPLAVLPGDAFLICMLDQHRIIGGGRILETSGEKFRGANAQGTLNYLQLLLRGDIEGFLDLYFSRFPNAPVSLEQMARASCFAPERIRTAVAQRVQKGELLSLNEEGYYERRRFDSLKAKIVGIVQELLLKDSFKLAAGIEEIRFQLNPNLSPALLNRALDELVRDGKLAPAKGGYLIPGLSGRHSCQREQLIEEAYRFARERGYDSFHAGSFQKQYGDIYDCKEVKKVLDHMHAQRKLVRLNDGRFLTTEAMQELKERIVDFIQQKGSITIKDCQNLLGFGRSKVIPILEYLDHTGVTRRKDDARILVTPAPRSNNPRDCQ